MVALRTEARVGNGRTRTERSFGVDQRTGPGDVGSAVAIGEEPVIADTRESWRENVLEETTQELDAVQGHRLLGVVVGIVAPGEGDGLSVEGEDATVGDGDSVGVVGQIPEHVLRTAKGRFRISMPVGLERASDQQVESLSIGNDLDRNVKRAVGIRSADSIAEEGAEAPREGLDGEQERDFAYASPAAAIEGEAPAGNDTMDMGMEHKGLAPGMKNGQHAHASTESRSAEIEQGLPSSAQQNGIDDFGRVPSQDIEDLGNGEDDVEVRNVEDFIASRVEPLLTCLTAAPRTVTIATRVPENVLEATRVTAVAMTAEGGRTAVGHGAHHFALGGTDRKLLEKLPTLGASDGTE